MIIDYTAIIERIGVDRRVESLKRPMQFEIAVVAIGSGATASVG